MNQVHESLERSHIRLLLALRDTGTLARAADRESISASAASHRLREAERRMGIALTAPEGRGLVLTPAGRHLVEVAAIAEANLRSAENAARWMASGSLPIVRLAIGFYDCAPWYLDFGGDESLGFRVDLVRVRFEAEALAVERRVADVAVELRSRLYPLVRPGEHTMDITDDVLVGVVSPDHEAARRGVLMPDDVRDCVYLTAGRSPWTGFEHTEFMVANDAFPSSIVQVESVSVIVDLVAAGRGLTILPSRVAEMTAGRGVVVVPLDNTTIPVRWTAILPTDPERIEQATQLADALVTRYNPAPTETHRVPKP